MDLAIGVKRLLDQRFGEIRPVGIGGVDEVDAEFRQALEGPQGFRAVFRRSPDAPPDNAHRAEAQPIDREGASDLKATGLSCVRHGVFLDCPGGRAQGQRAVGGMDDRIEETLPPVRSPKMVPRSYSRLNST